MAKKLPEALKKNIKKFPKGSKEAKEYMAKLRARRKKVKAGTPAGYKAGLGGQKIRSRGRGRGLGRGKGKGPIGVPTKKKVVGGKVKVAGFTRKGGVKVKGFTKALPKLTAEEKKRRAGQALRTLLPAAVKWVGKVGFEEALRRLAKKAGITDATKLAGWLKGQAKAQGVLSPKHPYVGRKGFRKYPKAAARMAPTKYAAYLRERRTKTETADEWLTKKLKTIKTK